MAQELELLPETRTDLYYAKSAANETKPNNSIDWSHQLYLHRQLVYRRAFLGRVAPLAGGAALAVACGTKATAIAPSRAPSPTAEPTVGAPAAAATSEEAMIEADPVEFEANGNTLLCYLSRPAFPGPHPGVLLVHENRGLLPHFLDVTRRLAVAGYVALAVDMLS